MESSTVNHTRPFGFEVLECGNRLSRWDGHVERPLSSLKGLFSDPEAYRRRLEAGDPIIYEVYEVRRPEVAGELLQGLSVLHAGRVGNEYYMTKGHFHSVWETAELYYCVKGNGLLLMESEEGQWAAEELRPGRAVYVPPRWAHRSINIGDIEDLATLFVYPGHAGHDYGSIERRGFRKLVLHESGGPKIVDNPAWVGLR
jgi:glucose-6-phosphate isomerase